MKETTLQVTEIQFPNAQLLPEIIKLLNEGHTVTLQLRGFSMRPFLEDKRDKAPCLPNARYTISVSLYWQKSVLATMYCIASSKLRARTSH